MALKKLTVLATGLAVAGSLLAAGPVSAAPASENQPARALFCTATFKKATGLVPWTYNNVYVTNGKKIKLSFTVSKGCTGKIKAYIGKKLVKSAKFKKKKATLTIPAAKFKAVKSYKLTLKYGKDKLKYTVWTTKGSLTPNATRYVVYMDNETPWTANVTWHGPVDQNQAQFSWYEGAFTTAKGIVSSIDYKQATKATGTTKAVYKGTATGWFEASVYQRQLNKPGTYAANLGFLSNNMYTYPRASLEVPVTIEVRSNKVALAPGVYTWPPGRYGYCQVTVRGTDRISGYDYFSKEFATGIQILPTDTSVEFESCGGGPTKIG